MRLWVGKSCLVLVVWSLASLLAATVVTSFHQPFRTPEGAALARFSTDPRQGWKALHFLGADCGCSQRVLTHLLERGALSGISEQIVVIGDPSHFSGIPELARRGFRWSVIPAEQASKIEKLNGVPLLMFLSPDDTPVYVGGYGAGAYRDSELAAAVLSGASPRPLPVIGCAVGDRLRSRLDPLGWKDSRLPRMPN